MPRSLAEIAVSLISENAARKRLRPLRAAGLVIQHGMVRPPHHIRTPHVSDLARHPGCYRVSSLVPYAEATATL